MGSQKTILVGGRDHAQPWVNTCKKYFGVLLYISFNSHIDFDFTLNNTCFNMLKDTGAGLFSINHSQSNSVVQKAEIEISTKKVLYNIKLQI